jgi:hypothetical protein
MATADPTFVEAQLNLRVEAQIAPDVVQWRLQTRDQTGAYADLNAGTTINSSTSNGSITTFSSAQATWSSTGQGSVHFGDTGFVQAAFTAGANSDVDNSGWSYTFTTGTEDTFTLSYAVATSRETDDPTGLGGFIFAVLQGGNTIYSQNLELDTADGVVVALNPNQTYTVMILPVVELSGGTGLCIASMSGDFDWSITTSAGPAQAGAEGLIPATGLQQLDPSQIDF